MGQRLLKFLLLLIFVCGLVLFLYPIINSYIGEQKINSSIIDFKKYAQELEDPDNTTGLDNEETADSETEYGSAETLEENFKDKLYDQMKEYNEHLYASGQSGLKDAFSYEQPSFVLGDYGLEENVIGYLSIEKMDIELPIYLGATKENMAKGAVNLGQTSIPIGGENTNVVLAGHRGYEAMAMFRDIEFLEIGDRVYITNLWEKLTYEVVEIKVILPSDFQEIFIQKGRDLLTLITCHPYTKNYQRYAVYCEHVIEETDNETTDKTTNKTTNETSNKTNKEVTVTNTEGGFNFNELSPSQKRIFIERWLPIVGLVVSVCLSIILLLFRRRKKIRKL